MSSFSVFIYNIYNAIKEEKQKKQSTQGGKKKALCADVVIATTAYIQKKTVNYDILRMCHIFTNKLVKLGIFDKSPFHNVEA